MVWGCISVHDRGGFICVKVPLMQSWMLEFWRDRCCHQGDISSREIRGYFSRTMPDLILLDCLAKVSFDRTNQLESWLTLTVSWSLFTLHRHLDEPDCTSILWHTLIQYCAKSWSSPQFFVLFISQHDVQCVLKHWVEITMAGLKHCCMCTIVF